MFRFRPTRRSYRARPSFRRRFTTRRKAAGTRRVYMSRAISREQRFAAVSVAPTAPGVAGTQTNLCDLLQGDQDGTRSGNKILVKELQCSLEAYSTTASSNNSASVCRVFLVLWRQPNGLAAIPSNDSFLLNAGVQANNYRALLNPNGKSYYKVLREWRVSPHPIANTRQAISGSAYDSDKRYLKKFVVRFKKGLTVWYNANTGNPSDVTKNQLCLIAYSPDNNITYQALTRMTYQP